MISLFSLRFHTSTHLYLTSFKPLFLWTTCPKTSCFINEFNSTCIVSFHFGKSFIFQHSSSFCGSGSSSFFMMFKATWKEKNIIENNIISIPFIFIVHITYRDLIIFKYLCLFKGYFFIRNLLKGLFFHYM